jgi:hypothetical protein
MFGGSIRLVVALAAPAAVPAQFAPASSHAYSLSDLKQQPTATSAAQHASQSASLEMPVTSKLTPVQAKPVK